MATSAHARAGEVVSVPVPNSVLIANHNIVPVAFKERHVQIVSKLAAVITVSNNTLLLLLLLLWSGPQERECDLLIIHNFTK